MSMGENNNRPGNATGNANRDRRGHGPRGILLPELPRFKTRSELFDTAVLDAFDPITQRFSEELSSVDIAVDLIPRMRLNSDTDLWPEDVVAEGKVPLGRLVPAGIDTRGAPTRPRIIIFRRPVELRATSPDDRHALLSYILTRLVAVYLNLPPENVDPKFRWDL